MHHAKYAVGQVVDFRIPESKPLNGVPIDSLRWCKRFECVSKYGMFEYVAKVEGYYYFSGDSFAHESHVFPKHDPAPDSLDGVIESLNKQPYDALYAHHKSEKST